MYSHKSNHHHQGKTSINWWQQKSFFKFGKNKNMTSTRTGDHEADRNKTTNGQWTLDAPIKRPQGCEASLAPAHNVAKDGVAGLAQVTCRALTR